MIECQISLESSLYCILQFFSLKFCIFSLNNLVKILDQRYFIPSFNGFAGRPTL